MGAVFQSWHGDGDAYGFDFYRPLVVLRDHPGPAGRSVPGRRERVVSIEDDLCLGQFVAEVHQGESVTKAA